MPRVLCGFCEGPEKITNEHVLGEWIGHLWGARRGGRQMQHTHTRDTDTTRVWQAYRLDQQVRMACGTCNSGWMHQLEEKVRPIITPMIVPKAAGVRQVSLDLLSQLLIATWAVKTAMVAEYLNPPHQRYFVQEERRALMAGGVLPIPGTHIWVGCFAKENDGAKGLLAGLVHEPHVVSAHVSVFALGQFTVQVFVERRTAGYFGNLAVRPGPWDRLLIEVWPPDTRSATPESIPVWPPPLAFGDDNSLSALCNRFLALGAEGMPYHSGSGS